MESQVDLTGLVKNVMKTPVPSLEDPSKETNAYHLMLDSVKENLLSGDDFIDSIVKSTGLVYKALGYDTGDLFNNAMDGMANALRAYEKKKELGDFTEEERENILNNFDEVFPRTEEGYDEMAGKSMDAIKEIFDE